MTLLLSDGRPVLEDGTTFTIIPSPVIMLVDMLGRLSPPLPMESTDDFRICPAVLIWPGGSSASVGRAGSDGFGGVAELGSSSPSDAGEPRSLGGEFDRVDSLVDCITLPSERMLMLTTDVPEVT